MQIVDAQIHVWGSGLPSNRAHRQVTAFPTEEAVGLMDEGGVDAAVIHPPGWGPGATAMAFAAVRTYPGRFAVMGALPLDRPENRALVARWRSQPSMLGLRYGFLQEPLRGWLEDGTLDWLWDAGAGETPQRGRQGDRRARLRERGVSFPGHAHVRASDLRRLRSAADVLGYRHHEDAVFLAAVRDDVHRGAAVAVRVG